MLQVDSVVDLAYERIRPLVLDGDIAPGERLGQVELAGPPRDLPHPGPRGAAPPLRRRAGRIAPEPRVLGRRARPRRGAAPGRRGAADPRAGDRPPGRRATQRPPARRARALHHPRGARSLRAGPPTTPPREFHFVLARATGNDEHVRILDSIRRGSRSAAACSRVAPPPSIGRAPTSPSTARSPPRWRPATATPPHSSWRRTSAPRSNTGRRSSDEHGIPVPRALHVAQHRRGAGPLMPTRRWLEPAISTSRTPHQAAL